MEGSGEGFSGTTIKDTWIKPRRGGIRGGLWKGVVGGRCIQLYLTNNKIIFKKEKGITKTIYLIL